jgi:membrane-associated phospholipid phosphatase
MFALLAALVAAGAFTTLDQWTVDHLAPGADFGPGGVSLASSLVPLRGTDWSSGWDVAVNVVTLPASFLVALAIVVWRSRVLGAALVACVAVEVLCKEILERPALHDGAVHIAAFDSSFPSGHSLRTVLVAVALRPSLGRPVVAWLAASLALLVLAGWHTPTDVAGGVLLGLLGARAAGALRARRLRGAARA